MCDMTHVYVWHDSFTCVTWLIHIFVARRIHMCDMTQSYVWHDFFKELNTAVFPSSVWHNVFVFFNTTRSYVWHDLFICVTWLIHIVTDSSMCDMTHPYVRRDSFICVTSFIHMCDMSHPYVWYYSFIRVSQREVGGWGRVPFSKKLMSPTPRRKWYLTTGRRAH